MNWLSCEIAQFLTNAQELKNRLIYNKLHWNLGMLNVADPKLYCLMQKIYSIILGLITIGIIDPNEICIAMIDGNVSILVSSFLKCI